MASSTTMPMASTRPNSDSVLTVKPMQREEVNVPSIETGTVSSGMNVARTFWRKMNDEDHDQDQRLEERVMISSIDSVTAGVVS